MEGSKKVLRFFLKANALLTRDDRRFLLLLLLFSIFISLVETAGVSAIMPFMAVAGDFSVIHKNEYFSYIYENLGFSSEVSFTVAFGMLLILFYLFRSAVNLLYFHLLARFSKGRYHLIAYRLFESYLAMPYRNFIERNSASLTKTIVTEAQNLTMLISAMLFTMSEIFIVLLIYAMFIYVNWKITLLLTLVLALNALLLTSTVSKMIKRQGVKREEFQKKFYEVISSTLGNFKMIKLRGNEDMVLKRFAQASSGFARANIVNETLLHFPRLFLEAIGFSLVSFIVIYLVYKYDSDISAAFGLLSMFVLGLYRLMPSVNRIMSSYNQILFYLKSLDIVHNELFYEAEELGDDAVSFEKRIYIERLAFSYVEGKEILKGIDLEIAKGSRVAFTGESGSGKSTLVDLIIGLYRPASGAIYIDDEILNERNLKSWRRKIGYIPQNIYLFDGTVARNVAIEEPIDEERLVKVLKQANIWDFLEKNHEGLDTVVGEGGVKLSGGQKQRIAIARALYTDPEVLILDEATSALDNETEARIMDEIYGMSEDKTLIIIAHRLSTLGGCDKIYNIKDGKIESVQ